MEIWQRDKLSEHHSQKQPTLQWVIVEGVNCHVSDYAHLAPKARPEAFCPVCSQSVIMRLGTKRAHHVAHLPEAICAATQPETVIHINSKFHIQKELSKSNKLHLWQPCAGWPDKDNKRSCIKENEQSLLFAQKWDRVEVEWSLGLYRLDVAMLLGDQVIGAVEVLVTHETEDVKKEYLTNRGVQWVEVRVDEGFYSGEMAWEHSTPLKVEDFNHALVSPWHCDDCLAASKNFKLCQEYLTKEQEKYLADKTRRRAYARSFDVLYARYVDFHYPSLKRFRSVYVIQAKKQDKRTLYAELQHIGIERQQIAIEHPPITEESISRLRQALKDELDKRKKPGVIINRSCNWIKNPERFHPKKFLDENQYPYDYQINGNQWEKIVRVQQPKARPKRHRFRSKALIDLENEMTHSSNRENSFSFLSREYPCRECGEITSDWVSSNGKTKTCLCRKCSRKRK